MDRRMVLFSMFGLVAGAGAAAAAPGGRAAETIFDELASLDQTAAVEDLPAENAEEAQWRHRGEHRVQYRGRHLRQYHGRRVAYGRHYGHRRVVVRHWGPVRHRRRHWGRRRLCRVVRNRYGYLVRRCRWVW